MQRVSADRERSVIVREDKGHQQRPSAEEMKAKSCTSLPRCAWPLHILPDLLRGAWWLREWSGWDSARLESMAGTSFEALAAQCFESCYAKAIAQGGLKPRHHLPAGSLHP